MSLLRHVRVVAGRPGRFTGSAARVKSWAGSVHGQRRRLATGAAALLAVGVGFHVVFGHNGLTAYEAKRQENRALTQQMRQLQEENEGLSGHVERLRTDPDAIEHEARQDLHYTRPGEVIVTLPADRR